MSVFATPPKSQGVWGMASSPTSDETVSEDPCGMASARE